MNQKVEMIANLRAAGHPVAEIARRMGTDAETIEDVLSWAETQEAVEAAAGIDDGTELYSGEDIKFFVEKMFPKALEVVEKVLENPQVVTAVQWKATEWVLSKASAIQELTKEVGGMKVINQFIMNDRAAGALEKLMGELDTEQGWKAFEESLRELPPGVE